MFSVLLRNKMDVPLKISNIMALILLRPTRNCNSFDTWFRLGWGNTSGSLLCQHTESLFPDFRELLLTVLEKLSKVWVASHFSVATGLPCQRRLTITVSSYSHANSNKPCYYQWWGNVTYLCGPIKALSARIRSFFTSIPLGFYSVILF